MRLVRCAVVGGVVMVSFMALNWLFGRVLARQAAYLIAYPLAVTLHFCLNKWWTFGCRRENSRRELAEYLAMVAASAVLQWAVFTALSAWTDLPGWLAAGIASGALIVMTFVVMQRRVFHSKAVSEPAR